MYKKYELHSFFINMTKIVIMYKTALYAQAKLYTIHGVSKRFDDQKFIDNVIGSYRHDFGLLDKQEQDKLRFECKEWMRAIKNNEPY